MKKCHGILWEEGEPFSFPSACIIKRKKCNLHVNQPHLNKK